MAVITISRQIGSLGDELAAYLASKLGCGLVNREYALNCFFKDYDESIRNQLEESAKFFLKKADGEDSTYKDKLAEELNDLADDSSNLVVVGLGGNIILGGRQDTVTVRVVSSDKVRINRISKQYNVTPDEADSIIVVGERKHKRFVSILYDKDSNDSLLYDLTFNMDNVSVEECADAILSLLEKRIKRLAISTETTSNDSMDHQKATAVFKNETEEEFARILDMYNIEWMYEPKTFPIEWDSEGNITMAFSPDFYLPKFNLYLELTTMEQKYVTKKNKKARKVMELYPGTNVRIVYKKDFLELVERFKQFGG